MDRRDRAKMHRERHIFNVFRKHIVRQEKEQEKEELKKTLSRIRVTRNDIPLSDYDRYLIRTSTDSVASIALEFGITVQRVHKIRRKK